MKAFLIQFALTLLLGASIKVIKDLLDILHNPTSEVFLIAITTIGLVVYFQLTIDLWGWGDEK